jgi:hypothetical protein
VEGTLSDNLEQSQLAVQFAEAIAELQEEPEFGRGDSRTQYAARDGGAPLVKLAVGNVPVDYDLWQDLRNPAVLGLHPAGLPEIWEFYANRRKQKTDESGRQSIFQIPRDFSYALNNYGRAVLVSMMLPFSPAVVHEYVERVIDNRKASSHVFAKMYEDTNRMADKAIARVAIQIASDDPEAVVIAMTNDNIKALSTEAIPQTRQGISHGPSKGGNYPQKSLAVLLGLGQFGVSRMVFRDEVVGNKVNRVGGPIRSLIIFDKKKAVTNGAGGVMFPSPEWRAFLMRLFDFTDTDPEIDRLRFCGYLSKGAAACSKCIENCPSGAQPSSAPLPTGTYSEQVARQAHRFWKGRLQFDFNKCTDERGQLTSLYPEWSCARCLNICLDRGMRKKQAVSGFYSQMSQLARAGDLSLSGDGGRGGGITQC